MKIRLNLSICTVRLMIGSWVQNHIPKNIFLALIKSYLLICPQCHDAIALSWLEENERTPCSQHSITARTAMLTTWCDRNATQGSTPQTFCSELVVCKALFLWAVLPARRFCNTTMNTCHKAGCWPKLSKENKSSLYQHKQLHTIAVTPVEMLFYFFAFWQPDTTGMECTLE